MNTGSPQFFFCYSFIWTFIYFIVYQFTDFSFSFCLILFPLPKTLSHTLRNGTTPVLQEWPLTYSLVTTSPSVLLSRSSLTPSCEGVSEVLPVSSKEIPRILSKVPCPETSDTKGFLLPILPGVRTSRQRRPNLRDGFRSPGTPGHSLWIEVPIWYRRNIRPIEEHQGPEFCSKGPSLSWSRESCEEFFAGFRCFCGVMRDYFYWDG